MYSALMVFRHMKDVHDIAYDVARELLRENGAHEDWVDDYLSELIEFSMMRKRDMLATDQAESRHFHYDFIALEKCGFNEDSRDYLRPDGVNIHFAHDQTQKELIAGYKNTFGLSDRALGNIFGMGKNVRSFARRIEGEVPVAGRDQAENRVLSGAA